MFGLIIHSEWYTIFYLRFFSFYNIQWRWILMGTPLPSSIPLLQRMLMHMCTWANILKNYGEFPKKPFNSSRCASTIELSENNGSSNQITEDMARDCLEDLFQPLISRICEEKWRSKDQGRYLSWFSWINHPNMFLRKSVLWYVRVGSWLL